MTTPSQTGPDRDAQNAPAPESTANRLIAALRRTVPGLLPKKIGGDERESAAPVRDDEMADRKRRRVPTMHHLEKRPESGSFEYGTFWCANRAGLGHELNEDAQFYDLGRSLFVSIDGISSGGKGRPAAQTFADTLEDYCGDPARRDAATPALLADVVDACASSLLELNGVNNEGGLVYAAVEFVETHPDGSAAVNVYAQGDVMAWAFSVTEDGELAGVRMLTVPDRLDEGSSTVTNCVALGWAGQFSCENGEVYPGEYVVLCSDGVSDTLDPVTVSGVLAAGHRRAADGSLDDAAMEKAFHDVDRAVIDRMLHAANEEMGVSQRVRRDAAGIVSSGKQDNYNLILIRYEGAPEKRAA